MVKIMFIKKTYVTTAVAKSIYFGQFILQLQLFTLTQHFPEFLETVLQVLELPSLFFLDILEKL